MKKRFFFTQLSLLWFLVIPIQQIWPREGLNWKISGVAIKHKMFIYALRTPMCMGSFKFKNLILYLRPNISIMYSSCILETGKCWQAHNSPIGWHFVFTNYPPIGVYRRVGLVWPAFNSTKTCQGYLYREGAGKQIFLVESTVFSSIFVDL